MKLLSKIALGSIVLAQFFWSCKSENHTEPMDSNFITLSVEENFPFMVEQFADLKVLRYQIPGWENLTLKEQKLVYYLTHGQTSTTTLISNGTTSLAIARLAILRVPNP